MKKKQNKTKSVNSQFFQLTIWSFFLRIQSSRDVDFVLFKWKRRTCGGRMVGLEPLGTDTSGVRSGLLVSLHNFVNKLEFPEDGVCIEVVCLESFCDFSRFSWIPRVATVTSLGPWLLTEAAISIFGILESFSCLQVGFSPSKANHRRAVFL